MLYHECGLYPFKLPEGVVGFGQVGNVKVEVVLVYTKVRDAADNKIRAVGVACSFRRLAQ